MTAFSDRVLDGLGPAYRRRAGDLLIPLVEGLAGPAATVDDAFTDTVQGWPALVDAAITPMPGWLAQLAGATVNSDDSLEAQRAELMARPNWTRGTLPALTAALRVLLVGTQRVDVVERDGSPWRTTITVYAAEVAPGVTLADLQAAAAAQKPVGIIFTVVIATVATFNHFETVHSMTFAAQEAAVDAAMVTPSPIWGDGTFGGGEHHIPEGGTTP